MPKGRLDSRPGQPTRDARIVRRSTKRAGCQDAICLERMEERLYLVSRTGDFLEVSTAVGDLEVFFFYIYYMSAQFSGVLSCCLVRHDTCHCLLLSDEGSDGVNCTVFKAEKEVCGDVRASCCCVIGRN